MKYTAIILSGGESTRMGSDKGMVNISNSPMIQHVINVVKEFDFEEILIIANKKEYNQFGYSVLKDVFPKKGPLGGIYTGLLHSKTNKNIVLSCDVPFINSLVISRLLEETQENVTTLIKHNQRRHNLIGIYYKSYVEQMEQSILNDQLQVWKFIESNPHLLVDLDTEFPELEIKITDNINSKVELKKYGYEL